MKRHIRIRSSCTLAVALLLAVAAQAQGRVWIVDASNGLGTDFTDFGSAVAAARDGEQIRVRAGNYAGATIARTLTVLGGPNVAIGVFIPLTVNSLPAGKQVVIAQVALASQLSVTNSSGRVLLDRLTGDGAQVAITDCRQVQINQCRFAIPVIYIPTNDRPTLTITRSTVAIADTEVVGASSNFGGGFPSTPAIRAVDGRITFARGRATGGAASSGRPPAAGIESSGTEVTVSGDAATVVAAGAAGSVPAPVSAINATGGTVTYDPQVSLLPASGGAPIGGTAVVTPTWLPSLWARGAPAGGIVRAELFSPAGDFVLFEVGLAADAIALPPFGEFWLDLALHFITGVGVQGASRHLPHAIPLPPDAGLAFRAWTVQAFSGTFAGGFKFSNPTGCALN